MYYNENRSCPSMKNNNKRYQMITFSPFYFLQHGFLPLLSFHHSLSFFIAFRRFAFPSASDAGVKI